MKPTQDFLNTAEKHIRLLLQELRPKLLEAHGNIEHNLKDDKTVVTAMDTLVEGRLKEMLHELDPGVGYVGEETGGDTEQETFWLVDPIDGTEPFIRGLPSATNMITLIDRHQPVMSIIYNFFLDEYFLAIKGKGATMNGHSIHVSDRPMERAFIVPSGGFARGGLVEVIDKIWKKARGAPKFHGCGYELAAIARGAIEGMPIWNTSAQIWDYAPGSLLVQEAGGRIENLFSDTYDYRNKEFVAANTVIFDELKQFVEAAVADHRR